MEAELRTICSELAKSIKRESDLELIVNRLEERVLGLQGLRVPSGESYSDSDHSLSVLSECNTSREALAKIQRKLELEKACIILELGATICDEKSKRIALERQVQVTISGNDNIETSERIRNLEETCCSLERRLAQERQSNCNFECMFSAIKNEMQTFYRERVALRDCVVHQLRAKIEEPQKGSDACSTETNSVCSEEDWYERNTTDESQSAIELLKNVEAQRDALHHALRSLLERQRLRGCGGKNKFSHNCLKY